MKRKENLTLVYQTLLCHQVFGNVDTGWFVVAAKAPWDQLCSHTHCSEPPLQLQCCSVRGSPLTFMLGPGNTRREQVPLNEEGNTECTINLYKKKCRWTGRVRKNIGTGWTEPGREPGKTTAAVGDNPLPATPSVIESSCWKKPKIITSKH